MRLKFSKERTDNWCLRLLTARLVVHVFAKGKCKKTASQECIIVLQSISHRKSRCADYCVINVFFFYFKDLRSFFFFLSVIIAYPHSYLDEGEIVQFVSNFIFNCFVSNVAKYISVSMGLSLWTLLYFTGCCRTAAVHSTQKSPLTLSVLLIDL